MSGARLSATIVGRVQGVGFRWWVVRRATDLGLTGWVMNADDERSVELVAEGDAGSLDKLARDLAVGPPGARVDTIDVRRGPGTGEFDRFGIMRP